VPLAKPLLSASFRLAAALAFAATCGSTAFAATGDLYVTSDAANQCNIYSGTTGAYQNLYTPLTGAVGQMSIHFGATNNRALIGSTGLGVEEFDATTGAYIKTYNPTGGWAWGAVYAPNGDVLIGDMSTQDVRRYDSTTGAFISVLQSIPDPSDMEYGPSGALWVCSFSSAFVYKLNPNNGNILGILALPPFSQANDIAFNPANNEILVTDMRALVCYRFDGSTFAPLGSFAGTGWGRPHGIVISPYTGHVLIVDGVTAQVHEFDPVTYAEITPAFLSPNPGLKIVDLQFKPASPTPTGNTSWGRVKALYR
jgi:DNA-binding beta-propeller fold protein YncE